MVERTVVAPVGDALRSCAAAPSRRTVAARPRAAQAGRDGPRGPERAWRPSPISASGPRPSARCKKYWVGELPDEQACAALLEGPGQRRHRAGRSSARCRSTSWKSARRTSSSWSPCRSATMDDAALERLSREGQLYLSLVEMQTIQAHFRELGPRSDRRRTGNDRPDLERALQPQDAGRADSLSRRRRRAAVSRTCSRKRSSPPRRRSASELGDDDWCVSVFRRQRRRDPLRRRSTTSSSRSKRTTIPRPSSPTAAPTPASAA